MSIQIRNAHLEQQLDAEAQRRFAGSGCSPNRKRARVAEYLLAERLQQIRDERSRTDALTPARPDRLAGD